MERKSLAVPYQSREVVVKNKTGIIFPLVAVLLILAVTARAAGEASAWLDSSRVSLGETVLLTIQADARLSGGPDTTPLAKDFQVLGTSSATSVKIVNGSMSSSTTYQISLQPKRTGTLTIPPLEVAGRQTQPLTLEVTGSPAPQPDEGADLFIKAEVVPANPYERQEVLYRVRLFHAVRLAEGSLTVPQPDKTIMQQVGDDQTYNATVSGRQYRVIERTYALFPQQPGQLTIKPPVFNGQVVEADRRRPPFDSLFGKDPFFDADPFGLSASTRQVRITGQAATVEVRPRPAGQGAAWLPADSLTLAEKWQPGQATVRAGEAITRVMTLSAAGQTGAAMPDLAPGPVAGFKVYPDKAEVHTDSTNGTISGSRQQKIAFIPLQPGTFSLPAVQVAWWNVKTGQMEEATLPARAVTVLPGDSQPAVPAGPAPVAPAPAPEKAPGGPAGNGDGHMVTPAVQPAPTIASRALWPLAALFLGAGWLATLLLWSRGRRKGRRAAPAPAREAPPPPRPAADPHREFAAACEGNDAPGARRSLLAWAAQAWPDDPPRGLAELAARLEDEEAAQAVAELDRFLFDAQPGLWDGKRLKDLLQRLPRGDKRPPRRDTGLPPLYPP